MILHDIASPKCSSFGHANEGYSRLDLLEYHFWAHRSYEGPLHRAEFTAEAIIRPEASLPRSSSICHHQPFRCCHYQQQNCRAVHDTCYRCDRYLGSAFQKLEIVIRNGSACSCLHPVAIEASDLPSICTAQLLDICTAICLAPRFQLSAASFIFERCIDEADQGASEDECAEDALHY